VQGELNGYHGKSETLELQRTGGAHLVSGNEERRVKQNKTITQKKSQKNCCAEGVRSGISFQKEKGTQKIRQSVREQRVCAVLAESRSEEDKEEKKDKRLRETTKGLKTTKKLENKPSVGSEYWGW
jgi:hypothetical protein